MHDSFRQFVTTLLAMADPSDRLFASLDRVSREINQSRVRAWQATRSFKMHLRLKVRQKPHSLLCVFCGF